MWHCKHLESLIKLKELEVLNSSRLDISSCNTQNTSTFHPGCVKEQPKKRLSTTWSSSQSNTTSLFPEPIVTLSLKFPPSLGLLLLLTGKRLTISMSKVTDEPTVMAGSWLVISFPFTNTAPGNGKAHVDLTLMFASPQEACSRWVGGTAGNNHTHKKTLTFSDLTFNSKDGVILSCKLKWLSISMHQFKTDLNKTSESQKSSFFVYSIVLAISINTYPFSLVKTVW